MKVLLRLALISSLLATAAVAGGPVPAGAVDTLVVTCTNGFSRTVAARAARGVATSLNRFNARNRSGMTCTAAPGAPRPSAFQWNLVTCTNGFQRTVPSRGSKGIVNALNKFNQYTHSGVSCSLD